MPLIM